MYCILHIVKTTTKYDLILCTCILFIVCTNYYKFDMCLFCAHQLDHPFFVTLLTDRRYPLVNSNHERYRYDERYQTYRMTITRQPREVCKQHNRTPGMKTGPWCKDTRKHAPHWIETIVVGPFNPTTTQSSTFRHSLDESQGLYSLMRQMLQQALKEKKFICNIHQLHGVEQLFEEVVIEEASE